MYEIAFCSVWRQAEKSKSLVGRIRVNFIFGIKIGTFKLQLEMTILDAFVFVDPFYTCYDRVRVGVINTVDKG